MDPDAVIAEARGTIDEALLTRTRGGFLERNVLAEEPLLAHLAEGETLQYLLAGPAPPEKHEGGRAEELAVEGSYRTLVAVTDARILLVAGSADGDRRLSLPYRMVHDVDRRMDLLTDTVVVETAAGVTWTVSVGAGSDVGKAVAYASERVPDEGADRPIPTDTGTGDPGGFTGTLPAEGAADVDDAAALDDAVEDAAEVEDAASIDDAVDGPTGTAPAEGASIDVNPEQPAGDDDLEDLSWATGHRSERSPVRTGSGGDPTDWNGPGAAPDTGSASRPPEDAAAKRALVAALFERLVGAADVPRVEQYGADDLERLVEDLVAHRDRFHEHLEVGRMDAALGAAGSVDALAAEGGRLATATGADDVARQVASTRREVRRLVVREALDGRDLDRLEHGVEPLLERLLQTAETDELAALVAELWTALGYRTTVRGAEGTPPGTEAGTEGGTEAGTEADRGALVTASQSNPVPQEVLLHVVAAGPDTSLGREAVTRLADHRHDAGSADVTVVVTAGAFAPAARAAAADRNVKLVDGRRLAELLVAQDRLDVVRNTLTA